MDEPLAPIRRREDRISLRFDKAFPVLVSSEIYGDCRAVARNVSLGGICVDMHAPPPIASVVSVHFRIPGSGEAFVARAEVKHHYCLNFSTDSGAASARGVGLRFIEFVEDSADRLRSGFVRYRSVH